MHPFVTTSILAGALASGIAGSALAAGPHGGTVAKSGTQQFEVAFRKDGLTVYPLTAAGNPAPVGKSTGTATFTLPGAPRPFAYPLRAAAPSALGVAVDLSKLPAAGTTVTIALVGLPDPAGPTATFTVPFAPAPAAPAATPAQRPAAGPMTVTAATAADQAAIKAQGVCKVSGESLGSMGTPIKVSRGDRAIFLCCKTCVKTVQADPARYFGF